MLTCKEVGEILSRETRLSPWRRTLLKVHLGMCACCKGYTKHMEALREGYRKIFAQNEQSLDLSIREGRSKRASIDQIREQLSPSQ